MLTNDHPENDPQYAALKVNKGVSVQPMVNPYLRQQRVQREDYSAERYIEEILAGNRTFLARAVTLVESTRRDHQLKAQQILEDVYKRQDQRCYLPLYSIIKVVGVIGELCRPI